MNWEKKIEEDVKKLRNEVKALKQMFMLQVPEKILKIRHCDEGVPKLIANVQMQGREPREKKKRSVKFALFYTERKFYLTTEQHFLPCTCQTNILKWLHNRWN